MAADRRIAAPDALSAVSGYLPLLSRFAAAWNAHDIDGLVDCVTEDCVFETSSGPHPYGEHFEGRGQLLLAFPRIWSLYPDARWEGASHVVCGDRGFSEWTFRGTDRAGKSVEMRGVDLFVFRGGKIARKDTFRKNVT